MAESGGVSGGGEGDDYNMAPGGGPGDGGGGGLLGEAVLRQVQGSPVLLNLAVSLAHHQRLLAAATAAAQVQGGGAMGDGVPARVREQLRLKAEDLSTTLRTILCL